MCYFLIFRTLYGPNKTHLFAGSNSCQLVFGKHYKALQQYKAALYAVQFSLLIPSPSVLPYSNFQREWCKNVHFEGCLCGEFYGTKD